MGLIGSSTEERRRYDALAGVLRRIVLDKASLPVVCLNTGVTPAEMEKALMAFIGTCRVAVLTEADLTSGRALKVLAELEAADAAPAPPTPKPAVRERKRPPKP